ncbi:LysR family transcriptional regulator [Actinomadura kijaniata]|uniref:LysR family transcriptional regulator n=1 Tax=Actinomadura kijaniata TaxID=46161 RepID=UPI000A05E302|nr:LysR family transcriptional regulator [Actinomadura kijaniata]
MEVRETKVFLVLAEELHFGRVGERLRLSPTRVSQTLQAMERRIGGRLVDRTSRRVRLTPLGERLRDGLLPVHDELNRVVEEARSAAGGVTGELRLGLYSQLVGGPAIAEIIRLYEERHPGSRVAVRDPSVTRGLEELRRGDLEPVASWLPLGCPDMVVGPVLTCEDRVLAVRAGHRWPCGGMLTWRIWRTAPSSRGPAFPHRPVTCSFPASPPPGTRSRGAVGRTTRWRR